jgi:hypothetical protein
MTWKDMEIYRPRPFQYARKDKVSQGKARHGKTIHGNK